MNAVIHTDHLDVGYEDKTVIRDVEIHALKGQTICLIGPNGAGKSTILRTLSGLLAPVQGTVYIGKTDIHHVKPDDLARRMSVVLTEKLNVHMTTAYEIVSMGRMPYTGFFGHLSKEDHAIIRDCMRTVGAEDLAQRDYVSLSDGEKQKVLIARALAQQPSLIILDEPTSHLDIKHKIEVVRILDRLSGKDGLTVILALHDVDIAVKCCQIVMMVKNGRVVAQGRPEDIITDDTIGRLYEIEGACYNSVLGSLEICNERPPEVFVAAGAGTGTPVFRLLSRMGFGVATGILYENDVDYAVAHSQKLTVISEKSFTPVSSKQEAAAGEYLAKARFVVDSGFPVGEYNQVNLRLLHKAALAGIRIFSFRSAADIARLFDGSRSVTSVASAAQLQEAIAGLSACRLETDFAQGKV